MRPPSPLATPSPSPGRGPLRLVPSTLRAGFTLIELLIWLVLVALLSAFALPAVLRTTARLRVDLAAREVVSVLRSTRHEARRMGANVAVKFHTAGETVSFAVHRDGDGDGVHNDDIVTGTDPPIAPPRILRHMGADVAFGIPEREPPLSPSSGRPLTRLEDPIRFNRSDLASWSPTGAATPGSVYISDGRAHLVVVRVVSRSGRVAAQRYNYATRRWRLID